MSSGFAGNLAGMLGPEATGMSMPLRESPHLGGLLEVNSQVEAAMHRARNQLQVSSL